MLIVSMLTGCTEYARKQADAKYGPFNYVIGTQTMMGSPYDQKRDASPASIRGMINTYKMRRMAINKAKAETEHNDVDVLLTSKSTM